MGIALLALLAATPAAAQKGGFDIGVGLGLVTLDDKLGNDTGSDLALRVGYFVTDRFELELRSSEAYSIVGGGFSAHTLSTVYHFAQMDGVVPFVLLGAGMADAEVDGIFREPIGDEGTALRAAFGTRFRFGEEKRASVRVELSFLNEDSFDEGATHAALTATTSWRLGA